MSTVGQRIWWWLLVVVKRAIMTIFKQQNFVVLSSGRSGSTLLTQLLDSHPQIMCKRELLNRDELWEYKLLRADEQTLCTYVSASLFPKSLRLSYTGFKLFNEQLEFCKLSLCKLLRDLWSPSLIILYRKDLLETYVSLQIAFQQDVWVSLKEVNQCSIEVDWDHFQQYASTERLRWRKSLNAAKYSRKVFLSFEELIEQREIAMNKIFTYLNLSPCNQFIVKSGRQNPLPLSQKISNYEDIMEKIAKSGQSFTLTVDELNNY